MSDRVLSGSSPTEALLAALNWIYDQGLRPHAGLDGATQLAAQYCRAGPADDAAIRRLIAWQSARAGAAGFLSGVGGLVTLPLTLPVNLASVLFVQLRMVAAIAQLRGHDAQTERVKALSLACLAGSAVADVLKDVGMTVTTRVTRQTLARLSAPMGTRLVVRTGSLASAGKAVPLLGGLVGAAVDGGMTRAVGAAAMRVFPVRAESGEAPDASFFEQQA